MGRKNTITSTDLMVKMNHHGKVISKELTFKQAVVKPGVYVFSQCPKNSAIMVVFDRNKEPVYVNNGYVGLMREQFSNKEEGFWLTDIKVPRSVKK